LEKEASNLQPFEFQSTTSTTGERPQYSVGCSLDETVEIYDARRRELTPIPKVGFGDEHLLEKIVSVLRHLHSYHTLLNLRPSSLDRRPNYIFKIIDVGPDSASPNAQVLSTKQIVFKNLESQPVFVSIFNLTSTWGVHRIFPFDDDQSLAVEPGKEIPELIVDMEPPSVLRDLEVQPVTEMRDILKIFITSKQTSFDHYQLKDFEMDLNVINGSFRKVTARRRRNFDWYCDQIEILTPITAPGVINMLDVAS
jgi:hypothetical protein